MSEPIQLGPDTSWGSHIVPLMACVCATRGPILEVGCGHWSTPLLHRYCVAGGRRLLTIDEDVEFLSTFYDERVCHHELEYAVYDKELSILAKQEWSVVLLDHTPGWRRGADATLFSKSAEYIVVHDYSHGEEVFKSFASVLNKWPYSAVALYSPASLVLGSRNKIPSFDKSYPVECLPPSSMSVTVL